MWKYALCALVLGSIWEQYLILRIDQQEHVALERRADALEAQIMRLQTDVSDLKQTADALGVACMSRR